MQIGRRIYFERETGNILIDTGERSGSVVETTIGQDFETYKVLAERVPETVSVLQLEFGQNMEDFLLCNGYRVNPGTLELEFSYPDPSTPPEEQTPTYRKPISREVEDLKQAVIELSILVANGGATGV